MYREKTKLSARDISKKIERGEIKIVYAKSTRRETLRPWVAKVLEAIGHPEAFVTDESMVADFFFEDCAERVEEVSKKLGVRVLPRDYVIDVANRVRLAKTAS